MTDWRSVVMAEADNASIDNFMAMCSQPRGEAIRWLQAHNNDVNNAVNAFYDNPNALQTQCNADNWDENAFHSDKTEYAQQGQNQPCEDPWQDMLAFNVQGSDTLSPTVFDNSASAPSRPPSRVSIRGNLNLAAEHAAANSNKQLTATERETQDLEKALALSMSQSLPEQETGVTDATHPYFGPANREHYDTKNWTMTLSGSHAREILLNPDPADRKREKNTPAFIKPSPSTDHLPALITILHAIPAAREALLMRRYTTPDYGHDKEWWDGAIIKAAKIVDITNSGDDMDWDEILFETQRLMAFLDQTERAYGSIAGLANMELIRQGSQDQWTANFLDAWHAAAMRAAPDRQIAEMFKSVGAKNISDRPVENFTQSFSCLEVRVSNELADTGLSLYDAVDDVLWAEWEETNCEEVYLESIGDVFAIQVTRSNEIASGLGIKVPGSWYLDRYLEASKHAAREMLEGKAAFKKEIARLAVVKARMTEYKRSTAGGITTDASKLVEVVRAYFDRANLQGPEADGVESQDEAVNGDSPPATAALATIVEELKNVEDRVNQKLNALELSKKEASQKLQELSRLYTKAPDNEDEPPHHKYTLRGVSADPHTTYVLEKTRPENDNDLLRLEAEDWQWWKISYSVGDAKPVSHTKVREVEVLKAARDESRTALLVYASERAVEYESGDLPPQLKNFVRADNLAFAAELEELRAPKSMTPTKRKAEDDTVNNDDDGGPNWGGYQDSYVSPHQNKAAEASILEGADPTLPPYTPASTSLPGPFPTNTRRGSLAKKTNSTSYDDTIPFSLRATAPTVDPNSMALDEDADISLMPAGQEMRQRGTGPSLVPRGDAGRADVCNSGNYPEEISMEDGEEDALPVRHVEFAE